MKVLSIVIIALVYTAPIAIAQSSSPWLRDSWTDEVCSGSDELCRSKAALDLMLLYDKLTGEGQRWIKAACPGFFGFNVDGCVYRHVKSMMQPGWPRVENLDSTAKDHVKSACPYTLGPSQWRDCAETEIGKINNQTGLPISSGTRPGTRTMPIEVAWSKIRPSMPQHHQFGDLEPVAIFRLISPSIYLVVAADSESTLRRGSVTLGSAVAVSERHAMTNCHIAEGQRVVALVEPETKKVFKAEVIRPNDSSDRCFLETDGILQPIPSVRRALSLKVGERVYTIGNPAGLTKTLGEGLLSGIRQHRNIAHIQISAPISQGSSGGALVDASGSLIGITTFGIKSGQSLNFAIAAEEYWK